MTFNNQLKNEYFEKIIQKYGPEKLSDRELFFYIINQFSSLQRAKEITDRFFNENQGYHQMLDLSLLDWQRYFKFQSKANKMLALCEFAKRCHQGLPLILGQICSSQVAGEYLEDKLRLYKQEVLYALYLDTKNQVIYEKDIFKGTLNQATVHPREIFKVAIQHSAAKIIVAHNHPSGNIEPSDNDKKLTTCLAKAGDLLGIELLDHLVIGRNRYYSFRENQLI